MLFVSGLLEGLPLHALYFNTALSVLWLLYVYALFAVCAIARRGRYRWWIAGALAVMMLLATARFNALQFERGSLHVTALDVGPVSYTHLDVYKRQTCACPAFP